MAGVAALGLVLVGCDQGSAPTCEAPNAASEPTAAVPDTAPAAAAPLPTYPAAKIEAGDALTEAFYPRPLIVHRCLNLADAGPAGQVKSVCARALELEPWNPEIRAALGDSPAS